MVVMLKAKIGLKNGSTCRLGRHVSVQVVVQAFMLRCMGDCLEAVCWGADGWGQ